MMDYGCGGLCKLRPKASSAASLRTSETVGCGKLSSVISFEVPISVLAAEISSVTIAPTMVTPMILLVALSFITLTSPVFSL